ncbi:MAG: GntR family transcriptional regulator, partial [Pseudomonadota bacterium]
MANAPKETCFADLKRRILITDLAPGEDLDEATLSERYGISRTPLREVLQRLAGDGYVHLAANRGAKVASKSSPGARSVIRIRRLRSAKQVSLGAFAMLPPNYIVFELCTMTIRFSMRHPCAARLGDATSRDQ